MSRIHYFQRYSHKENVATNNTLLLLSRFYEERPKYLEAILNSISDSEVKVGVEFRQQEAKQDSVPDGFIRQESFEIIVECKTFDWFYSSQLGNHAKAFKKDKNSKKILLCITKEIYDSRKNEIIENFRKLVSGLPGIDRDSIDIIFTSFRELVDSAKSIAGSNIILSDVASEFEFFCSETGLLSSSPTTIRLFPSRVTFDVSLKNGIYYRGQDSGSYLYGANYIGLYKDKSVRVIGKIIGVIDAVLISEKNSDKWILNDIVGNLSKDSTTLDKIIAMSDQGPTDMKRILTRYAFVDKFFTVNFWKSSKGGMQGPRALNLLDYGVNEAMLADTELMAKHLDGQSWG